MSRLSLEPVKLDKTSIFRIYPELVHRSKQQNLAAARMLFLINSTVITLTSKLFRLQNYHQVKLLNGVNSIQGNPSKCLIHFGQGHDARFGVSNFKYE